MSRGASNHNVRATRSYLHKAHRHRREHVHLPGNRSKAIKVDFAESRQPSDSSDDQGGDYDEDDHVRSSLGTVFFMQPRPTPTLQDILSKWQSDLLKLFPLKPESGAE
ncbi:hypothetical protein PTTG_26096 [Puccinia triticina 1-1 BBBD Race 1]|uniref:Uncharacterized protein n=2 Tax=Puccinia triticina TaxID=208348 RepID=A0A180GY37_PUCT1|nr:uncharacterized protein PtA15_17A196 [Puccinia triticina]OAV97248.1 hypothetical protein PTTG_26096 [Puccinia triticina 1-1 BBBD Race 1]WAQ92714.1 hypothetical protein PtA15_17A196 [Puccinia triticina]WAR63610.1 hypothetical protein PtB15_17B210 [Puccinia triticina]